MIHSNCAKAAAIAQLSLATDDCSILPLRHETTLRTALSPLASSFVVTPTRLAPWECVSPAVAVAASAMATKTNCSGSDLKC